MAKNVQTCLESKIGPDPGPTLASLQFGLLLFIFFVLSLHF